MDDSGCRLRDDHDKECREFNDHPQCYPNCHYAGYRYNETVNTTINRTSISNLKGSLRASISGILNPANLTVILDNETIGTVSPATPLYRMVPEGNHTVMVCMDSVCEQESVVTKFGTYVTVDFSDRVKKDMKFPDPLARPDARILEYFKNGNGISVHVEFINPSKEDLMMMVSVSCGYSYIDDRTSSRWEILPRVNYSRTSKRGSG